MKEDIRKAIEKFAGTDQPPEITEQVLKWLGQKINREEKDEALYALWRQTEAPADASTEAALRSVYRKIDEQHRKQNEARNTYSRKIRLRAAAVAAVLLIGLTIPSSLYFTNRYIRETTQLESYTSFGTPCTLTLPDGSTVRLKGRSTLLYPRRFRKDARVVHLIGEGYFNVVKQAGKPFRVHARGAEIVVKGTEFNLKAYSTQSVVEAVLVTGAIDFRTPEQTIALKPSQKVSYNTENRDIRVSEVDPNIELAGRHRTFREEPLLNVVAVIREIYGCRIELDSSLNSMEFTGAVDADNSLEHTLDVVTLSTGTRFIQQNDLIRICK